MQTVRLKDVTYCSEDGRDFSYDFSFSSAQPIAIMGKSGAGKTTLLDLVAGFLVPKTGGVFFNAQLLNPQPIEARPLSYLRQQAPLFDHLSVEKNLLLSRATADDCQEIAVRLGIDELMKKRAEELSGGEYQRVVLGQTLLQNRPLVLLDEPFQGLDIASKKQAATLILERFHGAQGRQILLIATHDERDVELLAAQKTIL